MEERTARMTRKEVDALVTEVCEAVSAELETLHPNRTYAELIVEIASLATLLEEALSRLPPKERADLVKSTRDNLEGNVKKLVGARS